MATTDTRTGFRLPWSSDRAQEGEGGNAGERDAAEAQEQRAPTDEGWPAADTVGRAAGGDSTGGAAGPEGAHAPPGPGPDASEAPAVRRPSKLMADLTAAMRTTAEAAREQALAQIENDAKAVVEGIRGQSTEGEASIRRQSDQDVAGIREWSKAEIARIREQTDARITERKGNLDRELAAHGAAIEQRIVEVERAVTAYEAQMASFFESLLEETDPAEFAAYAETMPEPPSLDAYADLSDLDLAAAARALAAEAEAAAVAETTQADVESGPEAEADAVEGEADAIAETAQVEREFAVDAQVDGAAEPETGEVVATADTMDADAPAEMAPVGEASPEGEPEVAAGDADAEAEADAPSQAPINWLGTKAKPAEEPATADDPAVATADAWPAEDNPWRSGEGERTDADASSGGGNASGAPVDREELMAAMEAAAEAVGAAEAAAESAENAEAAADVAETAAELVVGHRGDGEGGTGGDGSDEADLDPEAQAALSARLDAFEGEASFADRYDGLLPGHGTDAKDGEPRTTQVVVAGLVSVASIASFKRHLGRVAGVTGVSVSSGPDGEFLFHVAHRGEVPFRDIVPSLPGFAARVTGTRDGVVLVAARDPESEA